MTLTVHSSLSSIGWVEGGAPSVVRAFLAAIGERGTLAMPAATPDVADVFDLRCFRHQLLSGRQSRLNNGVSRSGTGAAERTRDDLH